MTTTDHTFRQSTRSYRSGGPSLAFNFLPIELTASEFRGETLPFESSEQLKSLRRELDRTHVATVQQDKIVCVPLVVDAPKVGREAVFRVDENPRLVAYLLQQSLVRLIASWRYALARHTPLQFVSRLEGRDLVAKVAPEDLRDRLADLHVYPEFRFDVRRNGPSGGPGILIGLKTRYEIDLPVSILVHRGVTVQDRYVLVPSDEAPPYPGMDARALRRIAGAVDAVDGDWLQLRDAPRETRVLASQAWLEGRREVFHDVLAVALRGRHRPLIESLDSAVFDLTGAEGRFKHTQEVASALQKRSPLALSDELGAVVGPPLVDEPGRTRIPSRRFEAPTFLFDFSGDKKHRYPDKGLDEFGPFDSENFSPKRPRIVVIAPKSVQGAVESFLSAFRNGVPGGRVFGQGFIRKYRLTDCNIVLKTFDGDLRDASAYRRACLEAISPGEGVDLAIVVTSEQQEELTGNNSPYLVSKSTFMSQGVPVQEVQVETIRAGDLASVLNSIALACYAKLGGTPYVISAPPRAMAHELVIGIGSSHIKPSRMAEPERFVGITTVFSSDGSYMLSNTSREANYEDYPRELLHALESCINDIRLRNAWQRTDALRLVFHVFKALKDREAQAVKRLVQGLAQEYAMVEFAFLHVIDQHEWIMFDRAEPGLGRGNHKGRMVPQRGHAVQVSKSEILVSVIGPRDMKRARQGVPHPMLLKLHRESTFTDLDYLAGQAFRFTELSWRRPYPSSKPVTIMYSDLIASLLGQLRGVTNWNSDIIHTRLRWSRWFL